MSMLGAVKDAFVSKAMRLMTDPRVSRVVGDPRVMNAAMKALNVGGTVKAELDKATRLAASVFGLATQEEVSALRTTIANLEATVAVLESRAPGSSSTDPAR